MYGRSTAAAHARAELGRETRVRGAMLLKSPVFSPLKIEMCLVFNKNKFCVCAWVRVTHVPSFVIKLEHGGEICSKMTTLLILLIHGLL